MSEQTDYSPLMVGVALADLSPKTHSLISYRPGRPAGMGINQTVLEGSPNWWQAVLRVGLLAWQLEQLSEEEYCQVKDDVWVIDFDQNVTRYERKELYKVANKIKD